jgi:hypothetical protein
MRVAVLLVACMLTVTLAVAAPHHHHRHSRVERTTELEQLQQWRHSKGMLGPGSFGADISAGYNATTFECLVDAGYTFLIQRAFRSLCIVDSAAVESINQAWQGGMRAIDVYLFPNRGCNQTSVEQVQMTLQALNQTNFGTLWWVAERVRFLVVASPTQYH